MKVLVIGGTGFISRHIVKRLSEAGHKVTILVRGRTKNPFTVNIKVNFEYGDRHDILFLKRISENHYDAVYDMIAYEPEESQQIIEAFSGKTGRLIHCSTISVYMISNELQSPITEDQFLAPVMEHWAANPFGMDYGINKRNCEEILWKKYNDRKFPVSILRPTFVCGEGDPTKRDHFWIERIFDNKPILVPGSGDYAFQVVYVEDAAKSFCDVLETDKSIGQAYNIAGEEIFSLNEYINALAKIMKIQPVITNVEQEIFDKLPFSSNPYADVFPFNTRRTAVFSLDKIKSHLNFKSTPFNSWMKKTINWYLNESEGHSFGYDKRNDEVSFIEKWKILKNSSSMFLDDEFL